MSAVIDRVTTAIAYSSSTVLHHDISQTSLATSARIRLGFAEMTSAPQDGVALSEHLKTPFGRIAFRNQAGHAPAVFSHHDRGSLFHLSDAFAELRFELTYPHTALSHY
jgi:hypothetical protein